MDQLEREEEQLSNDLNAGHITQKQYNEYLRDLHRSYREAAQGAAEDAARDAYENEMGRW